MKKYNSRNEVEEKYKWDLTSFFEDDKKFYKTVEEVKPLIKKLKSYKGKIKDAKNLLEFIEKKLEVSAILMDLNGYSILKDDEELGKEESKNRKSKVINLYSQYTENVSFARTFYHRDEAESALIIARTKWKKETGTVSKKENDGKQGLVKNSWSEL